MNIRQKIAASLATLFLMSLGTVASTAANSSNPGAKQHNSDQVNSAALRCGASRYFCRNLA